MKGKSVVVTHPISAAGVIPLSHLIKILKELTGSLTLITGNEGWRAFKNVEGVEVQGILSYGSDRPYRRVINFIRTQLWISFALVRASKGAARVIFFSGGDHLLIPVLTSRVLRKRTFLVLVGSSHRMMRSCDDPFSGVIEQLSYLVSLLSNQILVYSPRSIPDLGLERFTKKITICHEHFVKNPQIANKKNLDERDNIVGYVGRLAPEKGVMNLIEAIPMMLEKERALKVLVCGDGPLMDRVKEYSEKNLPPGVLELIGWINHDELPQYISKMKLIVIPSYTEGLPNVVLESMVCGTPVCATPVGSIPDIIRDGQNGFIMYTNDSKTIAETVIEALHNPNLSLVAENARVFVTQEFGFEKTLSLWRQVLYS